MIRKWLAIGIILLFVGVTIAPTININIVKASQQNIIKERINKRELLFQTICDIANNKEIQRIILKSQMSRGIFPTSEMPVSTENQLKVMYLLGLIFSKVVSKSRIQSMVQKFQLMNPVIKQEINTIIEKNATLKGETSQLLKLNNPINLTFFQILIWIIITSLAFTSLVISGLPMNILLIIWLLAKTIEKNHGVKILGDGMIYIIESIVIFTFAIFIVSLFILWICFGMPNLGNQP